MAADKLAQYATDYWCDYVILNDDDVVIGNVEDFGLEEYGRVGTYTVYRNKSSDIWHNYDVDGGVINANFKEE